MARIFISLIVKKYSLKLVKYQIAIQSILVGFVCLLSVLPVAINGRIVELSLKQALVFTSMFSAAIGCVNAFVDLQSHETKLVFLVSGKRILSSMSILFVELFDVLLQSTLYFIVLHIWFHFLSIENSVGLEIFSFYLIGSIQYFLISYFLSYFFKSPMGSLAILLLFPILLQPFIERVVEPMTSYLFYNIVADTILGRASYLQLCVYALELVFSLGATLYLLIKNQEVK
ncbi:hypothetical protein HMPREF2619_04820 [Streptococcus sp. HMSC074B11]|uniref:hypothetical protein n=1 Tax=Streptococcus sp. HMSC074B11 TaxID=1715098 RepID=UPI0008A50395|nr:hypothetical protein [Streptococcus sp. HMSC074B11]OFN97912.1 hypothetical protein HMPREF2619_04820 [Streptococcus sp. HMSC074B11]